jgi:hypothetical protein
MRPEAVQDHTDLAWAPGRREVRLQRFHGRLGRTLTDQRLSEVAYPFPHDDYVTIGSQPALH